MGGSSKTVVVSATVSEVSTEGSVVTSGIASTIAVEVILVSATCDEVFLSKSEFGVEVPAQEVKSDKVKTSANVTNVVFFIMKSSS